MKITQKQEVSFLNNDFKTYKAILVFGSDSSLVDERTSSLCRKIITNKDSETFSKIQLNYSEVCKDPSILIGHLSSNTLLAEPKFIVVEEVDSSISKELKAVISDDHSDDILIFKAGELSPSSNTRKFFETEHDLAALACYAPDDRSIRTILLSKMSENQIKCDTGVIDYAVEHLRGEYLTIMSEIDKMVIYGSSQRRLSIDDVSEIVSSSSERNSYDKLIKYLITSDAVALEQEFLKLTSSGVHVVAISRNIANYFVRIFRVKELMSQKIYSETEAISILKPSVFFKNLEDFKKALHRYSLSQIVMIIQALTNLEIECKTINIDPILCWDRCVCKLLIHQSQRITV